MSKAEWHFEAMMLGAVITLVGGFTSDVSAARVGVAVVVWALFSMATSTVSTLWRQRRK